MESNPTKRAGPIISNGIGAVEETNSLLATDGVYIVVALVPLDQPDQSVADAREWPLVTSPATASSPSILRHTAAQGEEQPRSRSSSQSIGTTRHRSRFSACLPAARIASLVRLPVNRPIDQSRRPKRRRTGRTGACRYDTRAHRPAAAACCNYKLLACLRAARPCRPRGWPPAGAAVQSTLHRSPSCSGSVCLPLLAFGRPLAHSRVPSLVRILIHLLSFRLLEAPSLATQPPHAQIVSEALHHGLYMNRGLAGPARYQRS